MSSHKFARITGSLLTILAFQIAAVPEDAITTSATAPEAQTTAAPAKDATITPATAPDPQTTAAPAKNPKPLLPQLPNFQQIHLDTYAQNIDKLLSDYDATVTHALGLPASWENTAQPIFEQVAKIKAAWNLLILLNTVSHSEQSSKTLTTLLPKIADFHNRLIHNQDLYQAFVTISQDQNFSKLTTTQQLAIQQTILDFNLNGATLNASQQQRYLQIIQRLRELGRQYQSNLQNATDNWQYFIPAADAKRLDGIPEFIVNQAAALATARGKDGWIITLDDACLIAVESYAKDRKLREIVYNGFVTLASAQDIDPTRRQWDNSAIVAETLKLRQELAKLLNYDTYAAYAVADRQPPNPGQALQFLEDLATKIKPAAAKELASLQKFAKQDQVTDLQAWDIAYYAQWEKALIAADSQKKSKEYFRTHLIAQSFFNLASILFNTNFSEIKDASTWHPDVKLYSIVDVENQPLAYVYLDLYARDNKNPNDRTQIYTSRVHSTLTTLPVTVVSTNLRTDANDLISHDAVVKLFTEFGEMLARSLATMDYPGFSSNNGMTWDAIAVASQFNQYWTWQKEYLQDITASYKNGSKMPESLLQTLKKANNYDAAINMLQQLEMAMLDLRIHMNLPSDAGKSALEIFNQIRAKFDILPVTAQDIMPNRFSESFTTDFAATYFTYYWDKAIAADAFSTFINNGIFSAKIGHKFRDTMLEQSGQASVVDLFKEFSNRQPNVNFMLEFSEISTK